MTVDKPESNPVFSSLDALHARLNDYHDASRHPVWPIHWVWLFDGCDPDRWLACIDNRSDNAFVAPGANKAPDVALTWTSTERGGYLFTVESCVQTIFSSAAESPVEWLRRHRRDCPLTSLHLVFQLSERVKPQPAASSLSDPYRPEQALLTFQRALSQLRQARLRPKAIWIHLVPDTDAALPTPELVLRFNELIRAESVVAFKRWRQQCLAIQDAADNASAHIPQTRFLADPDSLWQSLHSMASTVQNGLRLLRSNRLQGLLIHPARGQLSSDGIHLLTLTSATRSRQHHWLKRLGSFLLVALVLAGAYAGLGFYRQQAIEAHQQQSDHRAQALDRLPCADPSGWTHALALQRRSQARSARWLTHTDLLYPQQQTLRSTLIGVDLQSAQRWTLRCIVQALDTDWLKQLARPLGTSSTRQSHDSAPEETYQLLKTILMVRMADHRDPEFLLQRIKLAWPTRDDPQISWRHAPTFLDQFDELLETLRLPWPGDWHPNDPADKLVQATRYRLNTYRQGMQSEQWRLLPLIDTINGQGQPFRLSSLFAAPVQASIAPGRLIPAAYAPGINPLEQLLAGHLRRGTGTEHEDWVLGSQSPAVSSHPTDASVSQQQTLRAYWRAHRLSWLAAIESLEPKGALSREALASLARAYARTADGPVSELVRSLSASGQPAFQSLERDLGLAISSAASHPSAHGAESPWSAYDALLQKLVQYGSPLDGNPKTPCAESLTDPGSPLHRIHEWVKVHTQRITDDPLRRALRHFLLLPARAWAQQQWAICARDLNRAWASEVGPRLQATSRRYPFLSEGSDATTEELYAAFAFERLDWVRQLSPALLSWINAGLPDALFNGLVIADIDPVYSRWAAAASRFRQGQWMADTLSTFELRPVASPDFSEQGIAIQQQTLRYRNGPQWPTVFRWTGDSPDAVVALHANPSHGKPCAGLHFTGRMAWVRALLAADRRRSGSDWLLTWSPCDNPTQKVQFMYRHLSGMTPLDIEGLEHWPFPTRIFKDTRP